MSRAKIVWISIASFLGVCILIAGIVAGGYELGWFFRNNSTNREAHLILNGFNYQSTLGQQITKGIDNVTIDTSEISLAQNQGMTDYADQLKAQRESDGNTVCQQAEQITGTVPPGADQTTWIQMNCANGSISPSSIYYYVGG